LLLFFLPPSFFFPFPLPFLIFFFLWAPFCDSYFKFRKEVTDPSFPPPPPPLSRFFCDSLLPHTVQGFANKMTVSHLFSPPPPSPTPLPFPFLFFLILLGKRTPKKIEDGKSFSGLFSSFSPFSPSFSPPPHPSPSSFYCKDQREKRRRGGKVFFHLSFFYFFTLTVTPFLELSPPHSFFCHFRAQDGD